MEENDGNETPEYVIPTLEVDPDKLDKLDTKSTSLEKDGVTIKLPSEFNVCPLQLWEVYVAVAVLILQPHSSVIFAHVKALCEHNDPYHLCESILEEHMTVGTVTDISQDISLYSFLEEYFHRKFKLIFTRNCLLEYITDVLDDPLCGQNGIPRSFLLAPHVQAFLLNAQFWEGQYDELIDGMRSVNLPVNDVLQDGDADIGDAVDITWDNTKLYDDPNLILKKYGGWAATTAGMMLTPKDQLSLRLTGCTLDELLKGESVPDSPCKENSEARVEDEEQRIAEARKSFRKSKLKSVHSFARRSTQFREPSSLGLGSKSKSRLNLTDNDSGSSHASDYEVDPEHPKIMPFGVTLCEAYLLLRGILVGLESRKGTQKNCVVARQVAHGSRDGHVLAAAVLVDLYIREQIDVHHWTLSEGSVAVAYRAEPRKGSGQLEHFLDMYAKHTDIIFREMRLPRDVSEGPIWASLEERGVIDNHRPSWERSHGFLFKRVDIWDLIRPDLILDLKDGYLTAARVLYDKDFPTPLDERCNDILMFAHLLQLLFDSSVHAKDAMVRVLDTMCPPCQRGQLFPPVAMVHSSSVCQGLIDRAFRFANGLDVQLALEAAEFNEGVMQRLEETFFLAPSIWEMMDADFSGEISLEEFVEGMQKVDVYKDFRRERVPQEVLGLIIGDLAERLFHQVDINMDGTLTQAELQVAFRRRREEALWQRRQKQWVKRGIQALAVRMGMDGTEKPRFKDPERVEAARVQTAVRAAVCIKARQRRNEWLSDVDHVELRDEDVDVDTSVPVNSL